MTTLLAPVKSRLFISTRLVSAHPLDGAYASLQRGRSLDFEDLREYEFGDDVRDIDWKATARHGEVFVRRSRATRMHTVLFAIDTGRGMAALAPDEHPKSALAILTVGALGLLATRHGDAVSVAYGDASCVARIPERRSEAALEHALRTIRDHTSPDSAASSRTSLLVHVVRTERRRSILVVVTGEDPLTADDARVVRRLRVQHDILWVTIRDADPLGARRVDVDSGWRVPAYLRNNERVAAELRAARESADAERARILDGLAISHVALDDSGSAVPRLLGMLARRRRASA